MYEDNGSVDRKVHFYFKGRGYIYCAANDALISDSGSSVGTKDPVKVTCGICLNEIKEKKKLPKRRKPSSYVKPKGLHHIHRYRNDKGILECVCGKVIFKEEDGLKEKHEVHVRSVNQKRKPPPTRIHHNYKKGLIV